jgi:hypothetical protein
MVQKYHTTVAIYNQSLIYFSFLQQTYNFCVINSEFSVRNEPNVYLFYESSLKFVGPFG